MGATKCLGGLSPQAGTNNNRLDVPDTYGAFRSVTESLLYEIMLNTQSMAMQSGNNLITFTVGDPGAPANGATQYRSNALFNKSFIVIREGIVLQYGAANDICRYNNVLQGGFNFNGGQQFLTGQQFAIVVIGTNATIDLGDCGNPVGGGA